MKACLDNGVNDVINIKAQAVATLSEKKDYSVEVAEHPPEYKNKETIAGESKRTEVEQLILVRVVLCQLERDCVKRGSGGQLKIHTFQ